MTISGDGKTVKLDGILDQEDAVCGFYTPYTAPCELPIVKVSVIHETRTAYPFSDDAVSWSSVVLSFTCDKHSDLMLRAKVAWSAPGSEPPQSLVV